MKDISIQVADDHCLIADALTAVLNEKKGFRVTAVSNNCEQAILAAAQTKPDIVILDVRMGKENGIDIIPAIIKGSPKTRVIGLSSYSSAGYAASMMRKGAFGYVTKSSPKEELINAIEEVYKGKKYICSEIQSVLSEEFIAVIGDNKKKKKPLTNRELDIVYLMKKGMTSKEIAGVLSISQKTVEVHRYNILKKLNLKNVTGLLTYLHEHEIN